MVVAPLSVVGGVRVSFRKGEKLFGEGGWFVTIEGEEDGDGGGASNIIELGER